MAQKIIAADGAVYVKKKPFYLRWWFITLVILVLLGGCASMMGGGSSKSTSASSSSAAADSSSVTNENSQGTGTESSTVAGAESNAKQNDNSVPSEYKSALKKAESYSRTMHMSKQRIYDQLTSEFEKFTPEAAQYAVDNMKADWNANALESAKSYQ